jgi:hypothetical protein
MVPKSARKGKKPTHHERRFSLPWRKSSPQLGVGGGGSGSDDRGAQAQAGAGGGDAGGSHGFLLCVALAKLPAYLVYLTIKKL